MSGGEWRFVPRDGAEEEEFPAVAWIDAERLQSALEPLVTRLVELMPAIERGVIAYQDWGTNRLEALANGLIDEEDTL